jgi:hypothetical protein
MSTSIDFKAIWQQQHVDVKPDIKEVVKKSRQLKKKTRNKLLWTNGLLIAVTAYYIIFLCWGYYSSMITTRIGAGLTIVGFLAYLLVSNGLLLDLFKSHTEADSFAYLKELLAIKRKQELVETKVVKLYLITLSVGVALFMIEAAIKMGVIWGSVAYICLFGWMAFVYFYLIPRRVKKQRAEWAAIIEKLQTINDQLTQTRHLE